MMSKLFIFFTIVMTIYFCPYTEAKANKCVKDILKGKQNISPECITISVCNNLRKKNYHLAQCNDPTKLIMTKNECREEFRRTGQILNLSCQKVIPPLDVNKLEAWCNERRLEALHSPETNFFQKGLKKAKKTLFGKTDYPKECPPVDDTELMAWCQKQQDSGRNDPQAGTNILFIKNKCQLVLTAPSFGNSIYAGAAVPASPYGGSFGHGSGNFGAPAGAGQGGSSALGSGNFGAPAGAGQGGSSALGSGNFGAPAGAGQGGGSSALGSGNFGASAEMDFDLENGGSDDSTM